MTQDDIIRMAREARLYSGNPRTPGTERMIVPRLEHFAKLVERHKCEELARGIEAMPFGDTAASFAAWVRGQ